VHSSPGRELVALCNMTRRRSFEAWQSASSRQQSIHQAAFCIVTQPSSCKPATTPPFPTEGQCLRKCSSCTARCMWQSKHQLTVWCKHCMAAGHSIPMAQLLNNILYVAVQASAHCLVKGPHHCWLCTTHGAVLSTPTCHTSFTACTAATPAQSPKL
jgi:hypothetical protein